jgi:hypothetical protein
MRTVQTVLDFFFETPQAYFCDRCGECHRAGECKSVETAQREPKAEEKRADEFKEEAPRKPKEKRKRRIHKKKEKKKRVLTEPAGSAGPRQGSAAWSKDRYIRDDEDQA